MPVSSHGILESSNLGVAWVSESQCQRLNQQATVMRSGALVAHAETSYITICRTMYWMLYWGQFQNLEASTQSCRVSDSQESVALESRWLSGVSDFLEFVTFGSHRILELNTLRVSSSLSHQLTNQESLNQRTGPTVMRSGALVAQNKTSNITTPM